MVKRTDKKVVGLAIKYSAEKWDVPALKELSWDERDRLAYDICDAIDRLNSKEVVDIQKASDAIRSEGGLMLTKTSKGFDSWSTTQGTPINLGTAKELIAKGFVKPVGSDLLGESSHTQLYEAAIS
jgi:hypothetical protein